MLSDEVLDAIGDSCPDKIESSRKSVKDLKQNFSKKFDEDLTDTTLSDFIPLRTFSLVDYYQDKYKKRFFFLN